MNTVCDTFPPVTRFPHTIAVAFTMEDVEPFVFKSPTNIICAGATGSGKTFLLFEILKYRQELFTKDIDEIIYCYGIYQPIFNRYTEMITFHKGLIPQEDLKVDGKHRLLIIDDLMHEIDRSVSELFTKGSHHMNLTVLFITQNIFHKNVHMRDISLNAHYLLLFKHKRDVSQIIRLASQICPGQSKEFMKIYKEAVEEAYGYLAIDLHPASKSVALHRHILPHQVQSVVYF